jgi:hypothetical protein
MQPILCLVFLLCACLRADQSADRVAIRKVIDSLNEPRGDSQSKSLSSLFTKDADPADLDRLSNMERRMRDISSGPWSEVTAPRIRSNSIRFVSPDVALVDAAITQIGALAWRHEPVLLVLKKEGTDWRIASLRLGYR